MEEKEGGKGEAGKKERKRIGNVRERGREGMRKEGEEGP